MAHDGASPASLDQGNDLAPRNVAEAQFAKLAANEVERLRKTLSAHATVETTAKWIFGFLEAGEKLIENRGKLVTLLDAVYAGYSTVSKDPEWNAFAESQGISAMQPFYRRIRSIANRLKLSAHDANRLLKGVAVSQLRPPSADGEAEGAPSPATPDTSGASRRSGKGHRDPEVAKRRTALWNIVVRVGKGSRPPDQDICKLLDMDSISVPTSWENIGVSEWQQALRKHPNRVHKLLSTELKKLRASET